MAQAVLTPATATTDRERQAMIEALRYMPSVQMIGQSWRGARLLIEADDADLERVVESVRSRVAPYICYRRYA
jgi:hypothetical protein